MVALLIMFLGDETQKSAQPVLIDAHSQSMASGTRDTTDGDPGKHQELTARFQVV